jgi:hypothetical protein
MGMGLGLGMAGGGAVDELHRLLARQQIDEEQKRRALADESDRSFRTSTEAARRAEREADNRRQDARDAESARHNRETEDNARRDDELASGAKEKIIEGAQRILQDPAASDYDRAVASAIVQYGPDVPSWVFQNHPSIRGAKAKGDLADFEDKERIKAKYRQPPAPRREPGADDPELPRAIEDYIGGIVRDNAGDMTKISAEIARLMPSWRRDHPKLSTVRAIEAAKKLRPTNATANKNDSLLEGVI